MKVEIVRKKLVNNGNTIAFVDIRLGGNVIIKGCKVMNGQNGKWLAMPSQKGKDDKWYPIVMFESKEIHQVVSDEVIKLMGGEDVAWEE